MKIEKKALCYFKNNYETYTRYSGVADEEKKVLGVFNDRFLSNLDKEAIAF